jgi:hypothetical protein
MRIDGTNNGVSPLRLIQSPVQVNAPPKSDAPQAPPATRDNDSYSFDAVYTRNLPIQHLTEAHRKLERIRRELVAGRTAVPIHFQDALPRPNNPYLPSHLRYGADPSGLNESATQHAAEHLNNLKPD